MNTLRKALAWFTEFIERAWVMGMILCFVFLIIAIILHLKGIENAASKFALAATLVTTIFIGPCLFRRRIL